MATCLSQIAEAMAEIYANATPVVGPGGTGVHLAWTGPPTSIYAPGGWTVERRQAGRFPERCERLFIKAVTVAEERAIALGTAVIAPGTFPLNGQPCTTCTIELAEPRSGLRGTVRSTVACIAATRHGKGVAAIGPLAGPYAVPPAPVDRLVFYLATVTPDTFIDLCAPRDDQTDWSQATMIARLQLPVRELVGTPVDELALARSRLLPGEAIDPERFKQLAELLRGLARSPRGALLTRSDPADELDEMSTLDPLRMLYMSPLWRRALGFAHFDHDPALVPGQAYDYRISAAFPSALRVIGFHTVPSGTQLPSDFYLYDCRVRLPEPVSVERLGGPFNGTLLAFTRRGIRLRPASARPWLGFGIEGHCAVIDLPFAAQRFRFELAPGHALTLRAGDGWTGPLSPPIAIPAGAEPTVMLPQPASQLRLAGEGFLSAILVEPTAPAAVSVALPNVVLADTPRPAPPTAARASSLQAEISLTTSNAIRPRRPLGIRIDWDPASRQPAWQVPGAPPPLEASAFRLERRLEPAGAWEPVLGGEDPVSGTRAVAPRDSTIRPGADLMHAFPEMGEYGGATARFSYEDLFLRGEDGEAEPHPPKPGTMLRYRVAAVDTVGRTSLTLTETAPVRLEKHEPPPLPAGPIPDGAPATPGPSGVTATVLIRGGDLSAEEAALLGDSDNAIVLDWGWHTNQRETDPLASHFRIYLAPPLDSVGCTLTAVTPLAARPGAFQVAATLERAVAADAAKGQYLQAGYPFFIEGHGAGSAVELIVASRLAAPGGGFRVPATGPNRMPLNGSPTFTRPRGWAERVDSVVQITGESRYRFVLRDRLTLSEEHPRDSLWVGVSAADDEAYVADSFPGAAPRPGNESAIAAVFCQGRRLVPPSYQPPPPAAAAARIVAPEPAVGPLRFVLDLTPFLAGAGFPSGTPLFVERLDAATLLEGYAVEVGGLVALADGERAGVTVANPIDRQAILAALNAGAHEMVADHHLVLLAALHPFQGRLFRPVGEAALATPRFEETLPVHGERYLYRLRRTNGAGQRAAQGFVAPLVVRVPSLAPGPLPAKVARLPGDPPASLRLRLQGTGDLAHLAVFESAAANAAGASLVRVPDRPDLHPAGHVGLRLADGTLVRPRVITRAALENVGDAFEVLVAVEGDEGGPVCLWAVTLTSDAMPSPLAGPWRIERPYRPWHPPALALALDGDIVRLSWAWGSIAPFAVVVEQSPDGVAWRRLTPPLAATTNSFETARPTGPMRYRLRAGSQAGEEVAL